MEALQERELERATEMLGRVLANPTGASDREVARAVVEQLLALYRAAPALHRALALDGLRVAPTERVVAFDLRSVGAIRGFLSLAAPRLGRQNVDAAAFVIYQSVRATMLAYLLEAPPGVTDDALIDELVELIVGYLT